MVNSLNCPICLCSQTTHNNKLFGAFLLGQSNSQNGRLGNSTVNSSLCVTKTLTEAFPWDEAPRYLIRDRDRIYGAVVKSPPRRPRLGRMAFPNG